MILVELLVVVAALAAMGAVVEVVVFEEEIMGTKEIEDPQLR
jgi:hypothetical protein